MMVLVTLVAVSPSRCEGTGLSRKLLKAIEKGDAPAVASLIHQGVSLEAADKWGRTPLHKAVDSLQVVEVLLDAGARVDLQDSLGYSPLMLAARNGGRDVVARLLEAGANPNLSVDTRQIPSELKVGYSFASTWPVEGQMNGMTALLFGVIEGHVGVVQQLLQHGARLDARRKLKDGWYYSMNRGLVGPPEGSSNRLLRSYLGDDALLLAILTRNRDMVSVLLAAGAAPHSAVVIEMPVLNGMPTFQVVTHLPQVSVGTFEPPGDYRKPGAYSKGTKTVFLSSFTLAVALDDEEIVADFLAGGADPNRAPASGECALVLAKRTGSATLVDLLEKHGADEAKCTHS